MQKRVITSEGLLETPDGTAAFGIVRDGGSGVMQIGLELNRLNDPGQSLERDFTHALKQVVRCQTTYDDVAVSLKLFDFGGRE